MRKKLLNTILEMIKRWLWHILIEVKEGPIEEKRGRGKPRIMMLDVIKAED